MTRLEIAIRKIRERKGVSQTQLGQLARVRQATISDLENGKGRRVDLDVIERIAKALGVEPKALFSQRREGGPRA